MEARKQFLVSGCCHQPGHPGLTSVARFPFLVLSEGRCDSLYDTEPSAGEIRYSGAQERLYHYLVWQEHIQKENGPMLTVLWHISGVLTR